MTADLIEFLRARLDEDERRAVEIHTEGCGHSRVEFGTEDCDCGMPAVIRADVDAKRRIVAGCAQAKDTGGQARANALFVVACMLALPYADHPDYQQEWSI